ncbi:MAG: type I methionyl aminopeptidase [Candidatus Eisenbacteria sp.]|nr:type I methionyl aminopeptidase [Candidatus Eisenbacteria bacterium]
MRAAGRILGGALGMIEPYVVPGTTTGELERRIDEYIRDRGGVPAFKGYHGFPGSICASVNEEVVHGIPGRRVLEDGDILGVDAGVLKDSYYSDAARTFPVGEISKSARKLLRVTEDALRKGIEKARSGNRLSDISHAVEQTAEVAGFSVVRVLVGHGIGQQMHEEPQIPNFGPPGRGVLLKGGMTLAIEPMVNVGGADVVTLDDDWTVVTKDRSLSAHFEHTVVVGDGGAEILTASSP